MQAGETISADFAVVGCGIAGLRAAIELAHAKSVLVLAKSQLSETATEWAQGGIAAALSDEDEIGLHERDTLNAGDGLCNPEAVKILVEEGPHDIHELIAWGTQFDHAGTKLAFTREGAHSRSRILHAHGDSTGREISRALFAKVHTLGSVCLRPHAFTTELVVEDGRVTGARFLDEAGAAHTVRCRAVLLATGGLGQIYRETTNPPMATGDGMAIAYDAGAALGDMEFIQFHPTALAVKGAPPFLLSEALRGEGAVLRNADLERFMERYHPGAELAPRDIVSRAIVSEMKRTGTNYAYLDMTALPAEFIRKRFPRIYATCQSYGLDITSDLVPVRPAAHYAMGGVRTDLHGRASLPGLYAAGETATTGAHGANRLASNSLLEGLVFGARTGKAMLADHHFKAQPASASAHAAGNPGRRKAARASHSSAHPPPDPPANPVLEQVRALLWQQVGILRDGRELKRALEELGALEIPPPEEPSRRACELHNVWTLAQIVTRSALAREESRGSHYRSDFPYRNDEEFAKHSFIAKGAKVRFA
jgi:L-aspartate oxidase